MKLYDAMTLAERIQRELGPLCDQCAIAGSIRRARPEVNDIDLVILPKRGQLDAIKARCKQKCRVITDGRQNFICALRMPDKSEFQLDIFFAHGGRDDLLEPMPTNFGTLLLCRTGSKEHNVKLCAYAKSLGMKWSPYLGLLAGGEWQIRGSAEEYIGGKIIASETEEKIFEALGMKVVPPALREANAPRELSIGEILNAHHDSQQKATP